MSPKIKALASTYKRHELRDADHVQVVNELPQRRLRSLYGMTGELLNISGNRATVRFEGVGQRILPIGCVAPVHTIQ